MRGKIDESGCLLIRRKNEYKYQYCPRGENGVCGDWCPLFDDSDVDIGEIQLCNKVRVSIEKEKK